MAYVKKRYQRVIRDGDLVVQTHLTGHFAVFWQDGAKSELRPNGTMTLSDGFGFDGATGIPDTIKNLAASGLHDALIGMIVIGQLPWWLIWKANVVFYRHMRLKEVPFAEAVLVTMGTHILTPPWVVLQVVKRKFKK